MLTRHVARLGVDARCGSERRAERHAGSHSRRLGLGVRIDNAAVVIVGAAVMARRYLPARADVAKIEGQAELDEAIDLALASDELALTPVGGE